MGRSGWVSLVGLVRLGLTIHVRPPTSEDHDFFVRTPIPVFLDSMEIPLSNDSNYVPVEGSG